MQAPSTRPYLIRALHEWCVDHGFTPYIAVQVDGAVQVPMEFVKNGEIVLNVSWDATGGLRLGNDYIEFKARFGGVPRDILVPVSHVVAIYARENGEGMAFPPPRLGVTTGASTAEWTQTTPDGGEQQGMAAPALRSVAPPSGSLNEEAPDHPPPEPPSPPGGAGRPRLTLVK